MNPSLTQLGGRNSKLRALRTLRAGGKPARNGGSMFVLTAMVTLGMAMLAGSFLGSVNNQLAIARENNDLLLAELQADSALQFTRMQLQTDSHWKGTDGDWIDLGEGLRFSIERLDDGTDLQQIHMKMMGSGGAAVAQHEARLAIDATGGGGGPDPLKSAISIYGGDLEIKDSNILGDVYVGDDVDMIRDFNGRGNAWGRTELLVDPDPTIRNYNLDGTLYSYQGAGASGAGNGPNVGMGTPAGEAQTLAQELSSPFINTDEYLVPDDDRIIVTTTTLKNIVTTKTVVFDVAAGDVITLQNCQLLGGVVIHAPADYDLRGPARNALRILGSDVGDRNLNGSGVHPALGIIAPASLIKNVNNNEVQGLMFAHSIDKLTDSVEMTGSIQVLNGINMIANVVVKYSPAMESAPFLGMITENTGVSVQVTSVWESYPDLDLSQPGGGGGGHYEEYEEPRGMGEGEPTQEMSLKY